MLTKVLRSSTVCHLLERYPFHLIKLCHCFVQYTVQYTTQNLGVKGNVYIVIPNAVAPFQHKLMRTSTFQCLHVVEVGE